MDKEYAWLAYSVQWGQRDRIIRYSPEAGCDEAFELPDEEEGWRDSWPDAEFYKDGFIMQGGSIRAEILHTYLRRGDPSQDYKFKMVRVPVSGAPITVQMNVYDLKEIEALDWMGMIARPIDLRGRVHNDRGLGWIRNMYTVRKGQ